MLAAGERGRVIAERLGRMKAISNTVIRTNPEILAQAVREFDLRGSIQFLRHFVAEILPKAKSAATCGQID